MRTTIDRLVADAARQTARETALNKELLAKDRAIEAERDKSHGLHAKVRMEGEWMRALPASVGMRAQRKQHSHTKNTCASVPTCSFSLVLQLMLSEDRVHELTAELSAAKTAQQSAEVRAATHMDQVAKQKHALHEAHQAQMQDKERQIRAMRIIQLLSKR